MFVSWVGVFTTCVISIQSLHPLFDEAEDDGVRDNAAGAVARMLLAGGGLLPLEQVMTCFWHKGESTSC